MHDPTDHPITHILTAARSGDRSAADALFSLVYERLREIAHGQLRRAHNAHTLNTTAVVHEAYLRLSAASLSAQDRGHFYAVAAVAMRNIIVDYARARRAQKRGGDAPHVTIEGVEAPLAGGDIDMVALDDALRRLGRLNERLARVVDLRFFAGLTVDEVAEILGVTDRTVRRDWDIARAFLYSALNDASAA